MKKYLLPLLLCTGTVINPVAATGRTLQAEKATEHLSVKKAQPHGNTIMRQLAPGVTETVTNGFKRVRIDRQHDKIMLPPTQSIIQKKAASSADGHSLLESFEGWNGTDNTWIPEGWTLDMRGEVGHDSSWQPAKALSGYPTPADGDYYYGIPLSYKHQDEWLISPYASVEHDMSLSYYIYLEPISIYSYDNVDWDNYTYIGDKIVNSTLQIWAQPEDGEWTMLLDYAEAYKDYTFMELMDESYSIMMSGMVKKTIDISQFEGKKIKIAFRCTGSDGSTILIDAVRIGLPILEKVSYMDPVSALYWGMDGSTHLVSLTEAVAQYPVFEPITWDNTSEEDADYTWTYTDPATGETATSTSPYELTLTYTPDYSTEASIRNNLHTPPTLTATAPGAAPTSYTAPYSRLQAGGVAEYTTSNAGDLKLDLMPFALQELGLGRTLVEITELGELICPVFGYNPNVDYYWLNYSLNGEKPNDTDFNHLEGIANLLLPTEAPLVLSGVNVYGYGKIGSEAELTIQVLGMDEDMSSDISTMEVIASATIKGDQVLTDDPRFNEYLVLPFTFDTPVTIKSNEKHPAYFIMLRGFRSKAVEYFAPFETSRPYPSGMTLGYMLSHIDLSSHTDREPYWSLKPMVYKEYGEYVDPCSAFAFGLVGEYPWLTTDCDGITLTGQNSRATVSLGSYYDGSRLTVSAPEGVSASVKGRYDKCVLTVERTDPTKEINGMISVTGPGVEVAFPVIGSATSGIESAFATDERTVSAIYDLSGRRIEKTVNTGIYIIEYNDGSREKSVVEPALR